MVQIQYVNEALPSSDRCTPVLFHYCIYFVGLLRVRF